MMSLSTNQYQPWRRFLARTFDILLYNVLWTVIAGLVFRVQLIRIGAFGNLMGGFLSLAIMLFFEPVLLKHFKTTPGKAILGITLFHREGRAFTYGEGLERTFLVISKGLGYGIPFYNLYRLWKSYRLTDDVITQPWNESTEYIIKDKKPYRWLAYGTGYVLLIGIVAALILQQQLPPNRGELTVAEFTENHNYYIEHFDIPMGNRLLNEEGKWEVRDQTEGTFGFTIFQGPRPEYDFVTENGSLKEVTFRVEVEDYEQYIGSYDLYKLLASLAFTGAQEDIGIFTNFPSKVADFIEGNPSFESFTHREYGLEFIYEVEYSGFNTSQFLIPKEDESNEYRMVFTIRKSNL